MACLAGEERGVAEGVCEQSGALNAGEERDGEVACILAAELFASPAGRGATDQNKLIVLLYPGVAALTAGVLALGIGLLSA